MRYQFITTKNLTFLEFILHRQDDAERILHSFGTIQINGANVQYTTPFDYQRAEQISIVRSFYYNVLNAVLPLEILAHYTFCLFVLLIFSLGKTKEGRAGKGILIRMNV